MSDVNITLPKSSVTVSVKVLDIASPKTNVAAALFLSPVKPGLERLSVPVYSFLIEHPSGRKALFDLGPMKDFTKLPPTLREMIAQAGFDMSVDSDVIEQLNAGGVSVDDIDTVIWSHTHFDHTGDMSLFPFKTKLFIGKDTDRSKTFPTVPDAVLLDSDFEGREVVKLDWETSDLTIGGFAALDFFGDGSFYLMDTPGHCPGHLTALARVTEDTFILLGSDTCIHPGQLRPNPHLQKNFPCPGGILADLSKPILTIPEGLSLYADRPTALVSQKKVGILDAHPDVLLITSHDPTLENIISLFPETVNNWKELGWKAKAAWAFLEKGNKGYGYH
ncbi:hypothetical protein BT96DRAFT_967852 [Gymnopus androsaceus JB14]|uniref:Metallo-beta-lactamase domain-containing protein n=1 Tax=Gymnopus androsaceus JB14 TaxID=1447944 RepID=A0A6A4GVX7_9AGAR|nr:hypothetical protein BT96DRAFT_967852 [Gymnopus androsaceus JB14]